MKALIVALDSSGAAAELWDPIVRAASHKALWRERLVALDSSGAAAELWDLISRAPHPTEPLERAFSRVKLFRSRRGCRVLLCCVSGQWVARLEGVSEGVNEGQ